MTYILTLDQIEAKRHLDLVGSKAANVAELWHAGIRVPAGFVVTSEAYRVFCKANSYNPHAANANEQQTTLSREPMPPEICQAIEAAYEALSRERLPDEPAVPSTESRTWNPASVAVRSSATVEDLAGASFAGQYDTYLNVHGVDAVIDRTKACWASLWSNRAVAYRRKNSIDDREAAMAVLIQHQLPAEVSGVLFTLNPMTGREEEMTVEASWGLGEGIVSGRLTPDHFVVDADHGRVLSRRINDKRVMISLDSAGTRADKVPDAKRRTPSLADEQLLALTELGYQVQAHYGYPQDLEWALVDGEFYVLQSRPLTSFSFAPDIGQWTSANLREVLTGIVNPLSFSISYDHGFNPTMERFFRRLNLKWDSRPVCWARLFFSRPYWNVAEVKRYASIIPGFKERTMDRTVGITPTYEGDGQVTPWNVSTILRALPVLVSLRWLYATGWRQARDYCRNFLRREATLFGQIKPAALSDSELAQWVKVIVYLHHEAYGLVLSTSHLSTQAQDELEPQVEKLNEALEAAGQTERINTGNLLTGLGVMRTARPLLELWRLAGQALSQPEVATTIRETAPPNMAENLQLSGAGRAFWHKIEAYLEHFRYMSDSDENLALPRWQEDPTFVLTTLKGFVEGGVEQHPEARLTQQREVRRREEAKVRRLLSEGVLNRLLPVQRWLFEDAVRQAQRYSWWREETRDILARAHYHAHRFLSEQGRRWAEHGVFRQPDDIFWLECDDVFDLLAGRIAPEDARRIVAHNRRKAECYRNFEPPDAIYPGVSLQPEDVGRLTDTRLRGVACSSGVVTGRARVIHDLEEVNQFQNGEILVAPYTNPGWTPLFSMAAGIVMEEGGLMSHGAVVARECGIPAILQIRQATQVFKDGDLLRIDGTRGIVQIIERQ